METLPPFVILGHFDDTLWRQASATPAPLRTPEQHLMVANGPRVHPYGAEAYQAEMPDHTTAIFPSKDAYEKHVGTAPAQSALDQLNAGLVAGSGKAA